MNRFQHSDSKIFINNSVFPYDWWITQEPDYPVLPENCIGRLYVPSKRHHLTMIKGDTPCQCEGEHKNHVWTAGDSYIAKEQDYLDAYELFLNPPLTVEEQIATENSKIIAELVNIDIASVRAIREWITAQPNPPLFLVEKENEAKAERAKLK